MHGSLQQWPRLTLHFQISINLIYILTAPFALRKAFVSFDAVIFNHVQWTPTASCFSNGFRWKDKFGSTILESISREHVGRPKSTYSKCFNELFLDPMWKPDCNKIVRNSIPSNCSSLPCITTSPRKIEHCRSPCYTFPAAMRCRKIHESFCNVFSEDGTMQIHARLVQRPNASQ